MLLLLASVASELVVANQITPGLGNTFVVVVARVVVVAFVVAFVVVFVDDDGIGVVGAFSVDVAASVVSVIARCWQYS